jgi:hypothetical protein
MSDRMMTAWRAVRPVSWAATLVAAAFLCLTPAPAQAERRVALVIGNSAYEHAPVLRNPGSDAPAVAAALEGLGFTVLTGFDLRKADTDRMLREFAAALGAGDIALFYYAGHGLQVDGRNYIVPVDARLATENDLPFEAVDLALVLSLMERQSRTTLVFLDACRDNPLAQNLARSMGAARSTAVGRGLAIAEGGIGTLLVYATQPGNVALDGDGTHSPFTAALLDFIATPEIEIRQMLSRVRNAVLTATDGRQVPWDHSSLIRDFFFVPRAAAIPPPDSGAVAPSAAVSQPPPAPPPTVASTTPAAAVASPIAGLGLSVALPSAEQQQDYARRFGTAGVPGGLVISTVEPGSDAAAKGLRPGDVILRVQSGWVDAPRDLEREVEVARAIREPRLSLQVLRGAAVQTVAVVIR